jgi:hypothetical protein
MFHVCCKFHVDSLGKCISVAFFGCQNLFFLFACFVNVLRLDLMCWAWILSSHFVVLKIMFLGLLACDLVLTQKLQIWNYCICKTVDASCLHINIWSQVCFCSFSNNLMQFCGVLWNSNFFHPGPVFLSRECVDFLILMRGIVWYCGIQCVSMLSTPESPFHGWQV